jgi:hypothetical protein
MNVVVAFEEESEASTSNIMTDDSITNDSPTYYPWTGDNPPVKGRAFHCPVCKMETRVEFVFGGHDTDFYDPRSVFPPDADQITRYGSQQAAEEYLTDEALCDSCFRTAEPAQAECRRMILALIDAERAITQNDEACHKPLKELHDAMLPVFLKTFDFSVLQELDPEAFSKSIGDPKFLNPNSRNSMIQKYVSSGGGTGIAGIFIARVCGEGERIFLNRSKANAPYIATIVKNLPSASECGYAPWNIRRAISLNDYGGLVETQPRIPAPNTPDVDVWMRGALNTGHFTRLVTEWEQSKNRPEIEDGLSQDNSAIAFVAKTVLEYPRFERALRKLMMSLQTEAFSPKPAGK